MMMRQASGSVRVSARVKWLVAGTLCVLAGACSPAFFNNTTTLGGSAVGGRSDIQVLFINDTPFRALFTFGTYDPQNLDPDSDVGFTPEVDQFTVSADSAERLEGNSSSGVFTFTCGRAMSVGGRQLVQLLIDEDLDDDLEQSVLTEGVGFSAEPVDANNADEATAGRGASTLTLQGAEYQCDSLLVYTFSLDTSREECLGDTPLPEDCFLTDLEVLLP